MASPIDAFTVSAPCRVCILGEHQSYLGFDSIAMAVDMRCTVAADSIEEPEFRLYGDGEEPLEVVPLADAGAPAEHPSRFACSLATLRKAGLTFPTGYRFKTNSDIQLHCGLAAEAAEAAAWVVALLRAGNQLPAKTGSDLAELCLGAMAAGPQGFVAAIDAYVCSIGGKVHRAAEGESSAISLVGADLSGFVFGCASDPRDWSPVRSEVQRTAEQALAAMRRVAPSFDLAQATLDDTVPHLGELSPQDAGVIYALARMETNTRIGVDMLTGDSFDRDALAESLDDEHELLRDYFGLYTPELDELRDALNAAGAIGTKGCAGGAGILAFAPGKEDEVAKALEAKGWQASKIAQADGARLDGGAVSPPWA